MGKIAPPSGEENHRTNRQLTKHRGSKLLLLRSIPLEPPLEVGNDKLMRVGLFKECEKVAQCIGVGSHWSPL